MNSCRCFNVLGVDGPLIGGFSGPFCLLPPAAPEVMSDFGPGGLNQKSNWISPALASPATIPNDEDFVRGIFTGRNLPKTWRFQL